MRRASITKAVAEVRARAPRDRASGGLRQADALGIVVAASHALAAAADDEAAIPGEDHVALAQVTRHLEAPRSGIGPTHDGFAAAPGALEFELHAAMVEPPARDRKFFADLSGDAAAFLLLLG